MINQEAPIFFTAGHVLTAYVRFPWPGEYHQPFDYGVMFKFRPLPLAHIFVADEKIVIGNNHRLPLFWSMDLKNEQPPIIGILQSHVGHPFDHAGPFEVTIGLANTHGELDIRHAAAVVYRYRLLTQEDIGQFLPYSPAEPPHSYF